MCAHSWFREIILIFMWKMNRKNDGQGDCVGDTTTLQLKDDS